MGTAYLVGVSVVISVGWGALGAVLIWAVFRAIEMGWPTSYFSITDLVAQRVSASALSYTLFRFAPIVVVSVFVLVSAERTGGDAVWTGLALGLIHIGTSAGLELLREVRRARRRLNHIAYHVIISAGIALSVTATVWLSRLDAVRRLVPPVDDVRSDLWTALFAAAVAAAFVKRTSSVHLSESDLLMKARARVRPELLEFARSTAVEKGSDPRLLEAFLLVENMQRPRWFRRFEYALGALERLAGAQRRRTYGIMQYPSLDPIDDETSIEMSATHRLAGIAIPINDYGDPEWGFAHSVAMGINPDESYAELVETVFMAIATEV